MARRVMQSLARQVVGRRLNPRTAAEVAAGVTPANYAYQELNALRYLASGTDIGTALSNALSVGSQYATATVKIPYVSSGYTSSVGFSVGGGITIEGDGDRLPTITFSTNASTPAFTLATSYYSRIANIRIKHSSKATSYIAIYGDGGVNNAAYAELDKVVIDSFATATRFIGEFTWLRFSDVHAVNCGTGFSFQTVNMPMLYRCITDQTDQQGVYLDGVIGAVLQDCTVQYSGLTGAYSGIDLVNSHNTTIRGLWTEGNHHHTIYIHGTSSHTTIREGIILGSGNVSGVGTGIRVEGTAAGTVIDGPWLSGNASVDIYFDTNTTRNVVMNCRRSSATLTITDNATGTVLLNNAEQRGYKVGNQASTDPNTLDWYEEGSFTPVIEGTTSAGAGTYTVQSGRFTRIGNTVHFRLQVDWNAHTGTGNIRVAGLPYTAHAITAAPVQIIGNNLTYGGTLKAYVVNGQAFLYPLSEASGTGIANVAMDTAAGLHIAGSYQV